MLWIIFQVLIGYNLILPILLFFFSGVKRSTFSVLKPSTFQHDFAVIVTAYEETAHLPAVVNSLLQLDYNNYLIYIVADKCDVSKLNFGDDHVILLRPEETLASNTRSHFYAINRFKRPHEILTIIDSDNLVDPQYLNVINEWLAKGFKAVQGLRSAKNIDTLYAGLDAARDMYYHFYDGQLLFNAGSSATLAGSGMAFNVNLYKECLEHLNIEGAGFDKVLQFEIVKRGYRIAFTEDAIVYDEKTAKSDQLVKQRARWINTWFKYFKLGFVLVYKGLATFNWNKFLFGVILLRPPLFIFLLLSLLCMFINLFISWAFVFIWLTAFVLFISSFFIALKRGKADERIYKSLVNIPRFMFYQILSLLKIRKANKYSVATKHYSENEVK